MKRYILSLLAFALFFTSCEGPMDAINDEIDSLKVNYAVSNLEFTLTDANIKTDMAVGTTYFSEAKPAANYVPAFLKKQYPALGKGSRALVTYNFLPSAFFETIIGTTTDYTLVTEDYDAMGTASGTPGKNDNFTSVITPEVFMPAFLLTKFADATAGKAYRIFYNYRTSGANFTYSKFAYFNGTEWLISATIYELIAADYDSMGDPGNYDNFSSTDKPENYLPNFMKVKFPLALDATKMLVLYKYYSSTTVTKGSEMKLTSGVWGFVTSLTKKTQSFVHKGTAWEAAPDLKFIETTDAHTREYTLTNADFAMVGNGYYNNFDVRAGKAEESVQVRIDKISTILKANFLDLAENDVFLVHYNAYNGAAVVLDIKLKAIPK